MILFCHLFTEANIESLRCRALHIVLCTFYYPLLMGDVFCIVIDSLQPSPILKPPNHWHIMKLCHGYNESYNAPSKLISCHCLWLVMSAGIPLVRFPSCIFEADPGLGFCLTSYAAKAQITAVRG